MSQNPWPGIIGSNRALQRDESDLLPRRERGGSGSRHAQGRPSDGSLPANRWMLEAGALLLRTETELVLKSRRVVPGRLLASGFAFEFPEWFAAAKELCGRWRERRGGGRGGAGGACAPGGRGSLTPPPPGAAPPS